MQLRARAAKIWNVDVTRSAWDAGRAMPPSGAGEGRQPLDRCRARRARCRTPGGPIIGRASIYAPMAGPGFARAHLRPRGGSRKPDAAAVVRYTAIQDVGKAVHPSFVEGQMQGGAAQGIGWALNEEYVYDADGVMENAGFLDYRMPVASDLPMIDTVLVEVAESAASVRRARRRRGADRAAARARSPTRCATRRAFASPSCRCRRRACSSRWIASGNWQRLASGRNSRTPLALFPEACMATLHLTERVDTVHRWHCRRRRRRIARERGARDPGGAIPGARPAPRRSGRRGGRRNLHPARLSRDRSFERDTLVAEDCRRLMAYTTELEARIAKKPPRRSSTTR